jgi:ubiquinone/menaquinone biosynthesis C-methylase UbiE
LSTGIEDVKDYWDRQPCNIKHSNAQVGTLEYFNQVEERKYFVEPHIPSFAEFPNWAGKRVLEIGCGIGTDAVNFARHGALYTGIELSRESLKMAKERFEVFDLKGEFVEGDIESLDLSVFQEKFDLIYSFGVLHHTPSLEKALTQIRRLCDSKTRFKVMVYAKNSWKQKMIDAGLDQPEAQYGCPIANSYDQNEIKGIFKFSRFEIETITQAHIFPYVVQDYKKYQYTKEKWFESMPEEVFRTLENAFGWHMLIDAQIEKSE